MQEKKERKRKKGQNKNGGGRPQSLQSKVARYTGPSAPTHIMAAAQSITTEHYKLFPSPRNRHRTIFLHQVFVPHSFMLIDLESYQFKGKYSLFGACRLADMRMGQLVTLELPEDEATFNAKFVPD